MLPKLGKYFNKFTASPLLNCILIAHLLCGNYRKISDSILVCFFLRVYCILVVFSLTFYLYNSRRQWILTTAIVEYVIHAFFFFVTAQQYVFVYYNAIKTCDTVMGFKNVPLIHITLLFGLLIVLFNMCFNFLIRYGISIHVLPLILIYVTLYFNNFLANFYYSSILIRVKLLRKSLENNFVPVNIVGREAVDINIRIIRKCLNYYTNLMDAIRYFDKEIQFLLSLMLLIDLPKWIYTLYVKVKECIEEDTGVMMLLFSVIGFLHTIFSVCSLPILIEMIKNEVDEIKSILAGQLARCSDVSIRFELEKALRYIHMRPFTLSILNVFDLDIKLPFIIMGSSITYVIVALQFTHFSQAPK